MHSSLCLFSEENATLSATFHQPNIQMALADASQNKYTHFICTFYSTIQHFIDDTVYLTYNIIVNRGLMHRKTFSIITLKCATKYTNHLTSNHPVLLCYAIDDHHQLATPSRSINLSPNSCRSKPNGFCCYLEK